MPPGFHEKFGIPNFWTQFVSPFLSVISPYSDIILAQIYGHDHTDSFRFLFDAPLATVPSGYMLLAPSITPWRSPYYPEGPNNPAVRLLNYNESNFLLNDYTQYWTNLSADIAAGSITWEPLYSFCATYGVSPPLTAASLYNVYLNMLANETLFQTFGNYMSVNYPAGTRLSLCADFLFYSARPLQRHLPPLFAVRYGELFTCGMGGLHWPSAAYSGPNHRCSFLCSAAPREALACKALVISEMRL